MARPARFTHDDVLDAAAAAVAERGRDATIADVGRLLGAPSGSIYHRFVSREDLFAQLWLRSIGRFHAGLLEAYATEPAADAVVAAACHIPAFCREHPRDALALSLYRQPVLAGQAPEHLREQVRGVNTAVDAAEADLVVRRYGRTSEHRRRLLRTAIRVGPYGLVRPHLGADVPRWLDDVVAASARAIAELGDG